MAWTNPKTFIAGAVVAASELNTQLRDNLRLLRAGGIAVTSQETGDFLRASSATQYARFSAEELARFMEEYG